VIHDEQRGALIDARKAARRESLLDRARIALSVTGFIAAVPPSCQLQVLYSEKSAWWSYSTDVVTGPAINRSVSRSVMAYRSATRKPGPGTL